MLSTGFITSGNPISAASSIASTRSAVVLKSGIGTPHSFRRSRIIALFVAISADSGSIPGRPSSFATHATVYDTSVPIVITPRRLNISLYFLAVAMVLSTSNLLTIST